MADDEKEEQRMRVRYERNSDPSNRTQTIRLRGHEMVHLGHEDPVEITVAEYNTLTAAGLVLTVVEGESTDSRSKSDPPTVEVVDAPPKGKAKAAHTDSETVPSA